MVSINWWKLLPLSVLALVAAGDPKKDALAFGPNGAVHLLQTSVSIYPKPNGLPFNASSELVQRKMELAVNESELHGRFGNKEINELMTTGQLRMFVDTNRSGELQFLLSRSPTRRTSPRRWHRRGVRENMITKQPVAKTNEWSNETVEDTEGAQQPNVQAYAVWRSTLLSCLGFCSTRRKPLFIDGWRQSSRISATWN